MSLLLDLTIHEVPCAYDPELALDESFDFGKHHPCAIWRQTLALGQVRYLGGLLWSADGSQLFYRSTTADGGVIETESTFIARTPEPLFSLDAYVAGGGAGRQFDLAPDGDRFIFRGRGTAQQTSENPFNGLTFVLNWFEELKARVPLP